MKSAIREYIELKENDKSTLWQTATFVFDTNVYLDLYRYSQKTRVALLQAMEQLSDRIWMPNHVAHEFMKDRVEVIFETINRHSKIQPEIEKFVKLCASTLRIKENTPEVQALKKYVQNWVAQNETQNLLVKDIVDDPVLEKILELYDGKVGAAFDEEELIKLKEEGKSRYEDKIPPGYKDAKKMREGDDNNAYGDFIIWKEILRYAKENNKDIIFVTEDGKEDWWNIFEGKTIGPRIEVRKEFIDYTSQKFHMYSMDSFLRHLNRDDVATIDSSIIDEVKDVEKKNANISKYSNDSRYLELSFQFGEDMASKIIRIERQIQRIRKKNAQRQKTIDSLTQKYQGKQIPVELQEQIDNNRKKIFLEEEKLAKFTEKLISLKL